MKTAGCMLLVVSALIALVSVTFAQRGLPPNVPPNPNWVVSPWGEPPGGSSWLDLKSVNSMTYDPHGQGSIVVLVTPKLRTDPSVWVFDYDGKLQRTWGADMFVRPYDMIVDRFGYLWIIDENQNFVAKFTEEGQQLMTIGQKGVAGDNSSHDAFNGPSGLAVAKNGDIFVADGYNNSRIVKFDKNGKFLMMIGGSKGSQIGQFDLPHHVLIDSKDELVIQDRVNKRIQFWTQDGKFIKQWTDIEFGRPSGFAILPDDTLYVSDSDGQSIKILKDDKVLDAIGGLDGMRPHQITIDRFGALYVNDEPFRIVKKIVRKSTLTRLANLQAAVERLCTTTLPEEMPEEMPQIMMHRAKIVSVAMVMMVVALGICVTPSRAQRPGIKSTPFDVVEATIPEIHAAMKAGKLTARQLIQSYLDRIAAYDKKGPDLNCIITLNSEALADADKLDAEFKKTGKFAGSMHGIAVLVKDEIDIAGMPTTLGSAVFKDYRPTLDAFVIAELRKQGAIILGKTTLGEFAAGDTYGSGFAERGEAFGVSRNPYDLERTVGGSSGGSGACLAASLSTVALGEETRASIRRPGSFNAVVSMRPTAGLVSRAGMFDGWPTEHASMGPMARTVADLARLMDVMVGYDPEDPLTALGVGHKPASYVALDKNGLKGAHIGVLRADLGDNSAPNSQDYKNVMAVFNRTVGELQTAGAIVVDPIVIPGLIELQKITGRRPEDEALRVWLARNPNSKFHTRIDIAKSSDADKIFPRSKAETWKNLSPPPFDQAKYAGYVVARQQLLLNVLKAMADNHLDAIVYRTMERSPSLIKDATTPPYRADGGGTPTLNTFLVYVPAITVPSGFTPEQLPTGVTFLGRPYSDATVIALAYAYEQATHHRAPPGATPPLAK